MKQRSSESSAQNIGKYFEHLFIKKLYSISDKKLYVNPMLQANEDIKAEEIKDWERLDNLSSEGALFPLGETPNIRGRSKEIWKEFLGRGNKGSDDENFVLNYVPLPSIDIINIIIDNLNQQEDEYANNFITYMYQLRNPHIRAEVDNPVKELLKVMLMRYPILFVVYIKN